MTLKIKKVDEKTHLMQNNNPPASMINNIESIKDEIDNNQSSSLNPLHLGESMETIERATELEFSYWIMKKRQWSRIQRGTFTNEKRGFSLLWFLFFMLIYGVYLFLQIYHFQRKDGYILEFILMGFISFSLGLLVPRFAWIVRMIFLEGYSTLYLFFIFNLYYEKQYYIPLVSLGSGVLVFTIICFFVYPYIMRCVFSITGAITLNADKEEWVRGESNRFTIKQKNLFQRPSTCIYEGPLNTDGRPEGLGTWMDTSYQGELLTGFWEDGIPLGPFESMENDTRSLLVNLRIIYGTNGGGKSWLDRIPLNIGVASIECCVSGNFFKGYPKVSMIKGPDLCKCHQRCTCIKNILDKKFYRHIDDDKTITSIVVSLDKKMDTLAISGYKPLFPSKNKTVSIEIAQHDDNTQKLVCDNNWISSQSNEGILFIHGYDHDLKDALKRFAQFLALGHFPNYIKPFVFNWPSSTSPLLYWCAHSIASDNDNHRDLQKFIESLGQSGIRNLHIMMHSMGSRFALRSWSKIKKSFIKRKPNNNNNGNNGGLNQSQDDDQESINQSMKYSNKINLANLIFLNPDYEINTFKNDYSELRKYCQKITVYADHRDEAIKMAFRITQKRNLGNNIFGIVDDDGSVLDVDIIDTGDLDSNMSERHHSFFNINRLMVDDLHDLIVTGKRASERTSRLKTVGDVYRFSILPSTVVVV